MTKVDVNIYCTRCKTKQVPINVPHEEHDKMYGWTESDLVCSNPKCNNSIFYVKKVL